MFFVQGPARDDGEAKELDLSIGASRPDAAACTVHALMGDHQTEFDPIGHEVEYIKGPFGSA
jgi:hypothetical protein